MPNGGREVAGSSSRSVLRLILLRGGPGAGKTTVARAFAGRFPSWDFIDVDDIKERRHGTPAVSDDEDFSQAGRDARAILDQGRRVIVVEVFNQERLVALTLGPTGLGIGLPGMISCWLNCDVIEAVRRKQGRLNENVVRVAHAAAAGRSAHPGEIVLDTTSATPDQVVSRMVEAPAARDLYLG